MTLEQRVRRAERMLVMMANSGRRTRSEWGFKINSLIYAQMANEVAGREQKERIDMLIQSQMETTEQIRSMQTETSEQMRSLQKETSEQMRSLQKDTSEQMRGLQKETTEQMRSLQTETSEQIKSLQRETTEHLKQLAAGQAKTDEALRAFINSLRKGHNGRS